MRIKSYFRWLGGTVIAWIIVTVAVTILVDPYRMYGTPTIPGWTALKPRIYQQVGIAKLYQLERVRPRTLLLGNSRTEIGLDPQSLVWPSVDQPVFNAALAGTPLLTSLAMLRDDVARKPPAKVLLGLDFQDFLMWQYLATAPLPPRGPEERRLLVDAHGNPNPGRALQVWKDRLATTLTFDAFSDSLLTLLDQNPATAVTMTTLGFNPLREYSVFVRRSGSHAVFEQKAAELEREYATFRAPDFSDPGRLRNFADLANIMAVAKANDIELVLFTYPYHAEYLELLHKLRLWSSFENWKRAISKVAASANVPLYDFAEYDQFTTEQIPDPGDKREMRWWWEPGHYKSTLGDEMLNTMIRGGGSFGVLLTPQNVEADLERIRSNRASYHSGKLLGDDGTLR